MSKPDLEGQVESAVCTIEMIYEMFEATEEGVLLGLPLSSVVDYYKGVEWSDKEKMMKNSKVGQQVVLLSYLGQKALYYDVDVVEPFDLEESTLDLIELATAESSVRQAVENLDVLVDALETEDRDSVCYKLLRAMVVMLVLGNWVNASIVASLVLQCY